MRVIVIDSAGVASEAEADVVILCDGEQSVPIALARRLNAQVEFVTIQDQQLFMERLRQVLPPQQLQSLLLVKPQVLDYDKSVPKRT